MSWNPAYTYIFPHRLQVMNPMHQAPNHIQRSTSFILLIHCFPHPLPLAAPGMEPTHFLEQEPFFIPQTSHNIKSLAISLLHILNEAHSPVSTTLPLSQPLVLYHLRIKTGLSYFFRVVVEIYWRVRISTISHLILLVQM